MMNSAGQSANMPSTSAHGASQNGRRDAFGSKNGSPPTSADSSDETPSHFLWAKSLEHVMDDAEALELFYKWMELNDSINPIKFYYAIRAYKSKLDELGTAADIGKATKNVRLLAYEVYKYFIKDTGDKYCPFISKETREEVRIIVKNETGVPPYDLFDQCQAELMTLLRQQHALFSQSDELISAINRIEHGEPSDGSLLSTRSPSVASQRFDEESVVREMMDDVSDDEPAVAQSVMSGYSDAVTEQASSTNREPPPLPPRATSPRRMKPPVIVPKKPKTPKPAKGVALTRKALLTTQTQRSNAVDQRCALPYATATRPLPYVCAANTSKNDSAVSSAFSSEASAGQPYQPGQSHHLSSRQNKDDQARHNPRNRNAIPRNDYLKAQQGTTDQHVTQEQRLAFFNKLRDKLNAMMRKREMEGFMVDQMSAIGTRQQDARTAVAAVAEFERGQEHNVNDEEEDVDVYLNRMNDSNKPSPGSQRSPGGFFAVASQYRQRRSPKSTSPGPDHLRFAMAANHSAMTSSFPTPYGLQGFAPPPISKHRTYIPSYHFQPPPDSKSPAHYLVSNKRSEQTRPRLAASDTSGIGTGTSSADYSHVHDAQSQSNRKYFDKLRQLGQEQQQQQAPTGNSGTQKRQKPAPVVASAPYNTSSLPRQGRSQPTSMPVSSSAASSPHAHGMHTRLAHGQQSVDAEMTIGYYTNKDVDKHVPYVKKVPSRPLTFKEFKQHFALGRNKHDQFFFKRSSDDPQNPFELLLVTADAEVLPVFEGKVMAELKSTTDSD